MDNDNKFDNGGPFDRRTRKFADVVLPPLEQREKLSNRAFRTLRNSGL